MTMAVISNCTRIEGVECRRKYAEEGSDIMSVYISIIIWERVEKEGEEDGQSRDTDAGAAERKRKQREERSSVVRWQKRLNYTLYKSKNKSNAYGRTD